MTPANAPAAAVDVAVDAHVDAHVDIDGGLSHTHADAAGPDPAGRAALDPVVRSTRLVALASLLALIALGLAWELWLAPTGSGTLALKVLPLVLGVAGLWRHRLYTFRWLSLLVWLYVLEGVVRAWSDRGIGQWLAGAELLLCAALFGASAVYIRWRLRQAPPEAPSAPPANAT